MGPSGSGKSTLLYTVSGGQLQRACVCRSMINNPKLLFADEPTGALNRTTSMEVMDGLEAESGRYHDHDGYPRCQSRCKVQARAVHQ